MSLTGYLFESIDEIAPFIEPTPPLKSTLKDSDLVISASIRWAHEKAVSRVEGLPDGIYNSSAIINPQGMVEHVYRKHFLYEAEEHWALPGSGFSHLELASIGRVGVGICMDLNHNTKVDDSFSKCEFAKYHAEQQTSLVMVPMNWLKSWEVDDSLPSTITLLYWITRLKPLIDSLKPGQRVLVAACNRIGTERGTTFTGTSCILELSLSNSNQEHSKLLDLIKETADIINRLSESNPDFSRKYDELIAMATQAFDLLDKVQLIGSLSASFEGLLECSVSLNQP